MADILGKIIMIACPNCNHSNPDAATQCEACYTPLPTTIPCPNCGNPVQTEAVFCGNCGHNLKPDLPQASENQSVAVPSGTPTVVSAAPEAPPNPVNPVTPDPTIPVNPVPPNLEKSNESNAPATAPTVPVIPEPDPAIEANLTPVPTVVSPPPAAPEPVPQVEVSAPAPLPPVSAVPPTPPVVGTVAKTQLQQTSARLLHVQTNTTLELPGNISVIHIGKPNDLVPPDIDVSGFPHSEIVSRSHADIRVEGDVYFIEDLASSNGTYINNAPLPKGNRHRLRPGDRIALGKGDLVTFVFQIS